MGKLNYESHIQHFSHEHPLELTDILQLQHYPNITRATTCSGCKEGASPGDQWIYSCKFCNFNLHIPCAQMPKFINHPSDQKHPLFLFPSPAYPGGIFNCDDCGRQNNTGFSYHCTVCSIDLHILCATKSVTVNHQAHPLHHAVHSPANNQGLFGQQPQPQTQPNLVSQGVGHQGIPMINSNMALPQQQQRLYDHANSSPSTGSVHELFMNSQQDYNQQLQQHLEQLQQQQQRAATAFQGMFAGVSQQLGQRSQNILQSVLGGGNNGGRGVASDIFQSILGGGNIGGGGGGGASDIFQSILHGGNSSGILGGGGVDPSTSTLNSINQSLDVLGTIGATGNYDIGGGVSPSTSTLNSINRSLLDSKIIRVNRSLDVMGTIGATGKYDITYQSNSGGGGGGGGYDLGNIR